MRLRPSCIRSLRGGLRLGSKWLAYRLTAGGSVLLSLGYGEIDAVGGWVNAT